MSEMGLRCLCMMLSVTAWGLRGADCAASVGDREAPFVSAQLHFVFIKEFSQGFAFHPLILAQKLSLAMVGFDVTHKPIPVGS